MSKRIDRLEARSVVQEMLILQAIGEIYRQTENGSERVKNLMAGVERMLLEAARSAPQDERETAKLACQYFREISLRFIGALPHQGMH